VQPLGWDDVDQLGEAVNPAAQALTRDQAQALIARQMPVSPWRVVGVQAGVGLALALAMVLLSSPMAWVGSFLYGTAAVVLPSALMAWGISKPRAGRPAGSGLASFMVWEAVKVGLSVVMLLLAPLILQPLSWPALLAGLVVCLKCYWAALLWRGSKKN